MLNGLYALVCTSGIIVIVIYFTIKPFRDTLITWYPFRGILRWTKSLKKGQKKGLKKGKSLKKGL